MQVIHKDNILFTWIYSLLILLITITTVVAVKKPLLLLLLPFLEGIYLYFAFRRPYRRYQLLKQAFPETWKQQLAKNSRFYRNLDEREKKRFEDDVQIILNEIPIRSIRQGEVSEESRLLVAGAAATMIHGRPEWEPPIRDGIIIYPGTRFDRHYRMGKGNFAGMATRNAPMLLTEKSIRQHAGNPDEGYNVVIHEFAHYFDQSMTGANWKAIIADEWKKAFAGESFLGTYAGSNEAECFAVAVEVFFEDPQYMIANNQALYNALKEFFNLDTMKILKDASGGQEPF